MSTAAFVVLGDTRTRSTELRALRWRARRLHEAELILCKERIGADDRDAVRHWVESDLRPTDTNLRSLLAFARRRRLSVAGVLPHCDAGVPLASLLADRLELPVADPFRAEAVRAVAGAPHLRYGGRWPEGTRSYGVDHVAGFSWVSEQERIGRPDGMVVQQIVPAPVDPGTEARLTLTGFTAAEDRGFDGGVFHTDVVGLPDGSTGALSPALCPARLRGWDLASLAFAGLDPWEQWLRYSREGTPAAGEFPERAVAGIRLIRAPRDGVLESAPLGLLPRLLDEHHPWLREISFAKQAGSPVSRAVVDEDDFLGYVICATPAHEDTRRILLDCSSRIEHALEIS